MLGLCVMPKISPKLSYMIEGSSTRWVFYMYNLFEAGYREEYQPNVPVVISLWSKAYTYPSL